MTMILLAGDDLEEGQALSPLLADAGYRVRVAQSVGAAINVLSTMPTDLAILCWRASQGNDELTRWVRDQPAMQGMPILVIGGDASTRARLAALSGGADDHLARPFESEQLLARIASLLNRRDSLPSVCPKGFSRRILVVDDSPTYAHALTEQLHKDGHDVVIAATGGDALTFLDSSRADLVLLDVFLPDINGIDVCRRIKSMPHTAQVPVLMLTGREKTAVRDAAASAGADDFAVKSRDFETIRNKSRALLVRITARLGSSPKVLAVDLLPQQNLAPRISKATAEAESASLRTNPELRSAFRAESAGSRGDPENGASPRQEAGPSRPNAERHSSPRLDAVSARSPMDGYASARTPSPTRPNADFRSAPRVDSGSTRFGGEAGPSPVSEPRASQRKVSAPRMSATSQSAARTDETPSAGSGDGIIHPSIGGNHLFERIVSRTGLSEVLARSTVAGVCKKLNLNPANLAPRDLPRVVQALNRALHLFLSPAEARERMIALDGEVKRSTSR